jgi:hypothetical protein
MVPEHTYDSATGRPFLQTLVLRDKESYVIPFMILTVLLMSQSAGMSRAPTMQSLNCDLFRHLRLPKKGLLTVPNPGAVPVFGPHLAPTSV